MGLGLGAGAIYALALAVAFWPVLGWDTVFVAPDAPILPLDWAAGWRHFFTVPTLHALLTALLPYPIAYEGTFWADGAVMALAGAFLLRSRGSSAGAAIVGGFCAAFAGYFATLFCAGHRGVVDALAVTALGFGALERLLRTGRLRWGAALGAILAFGLGAQADLWLLMLCALGAYGLMHLGSAWRTQRWRLVRALAFAGCVFALVGLPALRHTFGAARQTRAEQMASATAASADAGQAREARWRFITGWSLPPRETLDCLWPGLFGRTSYPFDPHPYTGQMGDPEHGIRLRQHSLFLGWAMLLLAARAWLLRPEAATRCERRFWTLLALGALLLAFGRYTPLYRLIFCIPGLNQIRAPVKWLHLTGFALAMVAGLGAEGWPTRRTWAALCCCALVAFPGAWLIRGYVFPRSLAHNALTQAVPPGKSLCNPLNLRALDDLCRWQGIALEQDLGRADYAILPAPQPNLPAPVALLRTQGLALGLYSLAPLQRSP